MKFSRIGALRAIFIADPAHIVSATGEAIELGRSVMRQLKCALVQGLSYSERRSGVSLSGCKTINPQARRSGRGCGDCSGAHACRRMPAELAALVSWTG